jgi:hypothetical protein
MPIPGQGTGGGSIRVGVPHSPISGNSERLDGVQPRSETSVGGEPYGWVGLRLLQDVRARCSSIGTSITVGTSRCQAATSAS